MPATAPRPDCDQPIRVVDGPWLLRVWRALRDPLAFLTGVEAKYGDIAALREGRTYAVFHPDYTRHVLQDNHPNYTKGPKYRAALSPLMGNGLFTSEGAFWLRQRRLAQGAFQHRHLENVAGPVAACVADLAARWRAKARRAEPLALRQELMELTLRIALRNLFGTDADSQLPRLIPAIHVVNDSIRLAAQFVPQPPPWVPTPGRLRFQAALRTIDEFVWGVVRRRRAADDGGADLVSLLLHARDEETGAQMDDLQLRDELVTMLNAGHDTVTDSLAWTLVLLAQHPEHRRQAREEVRRVLAGAPPTPEALYHLPLLGRIFHESTRLYPPAWGMGRTAIGEDRIGPHRIPAGALVLISPYVVHRSPRFWERPLVFDPDRFLPQNVEARHKFAYFPFGAGPRKCIGAGLVALEAPLILAAILQEFDFELHGNPTVTPSPRISLRPKGTVWLRVHPAG